MPGLAKEKIAFLCFPFSQKRLGLYLHIPFCRYLCTYCDFHKTLSLERLVKKFVSFFLEDLAQCLSFFRSYRFSSVFFGGGTPALLPFSFFDQVLSCLQPYLEDGAEISLETTPDAVEEEKFLALRKRGFNRVSVGIASLNPSILKKLHRCYSPEDVRRACDRLRATGWENVSGDLLFGIPGQERSSFLEDVKTLVQWKLPHLSLYGLQLEKKTKLYRDVQSRKEKEVEQEEYAASYLQASAFLEEAGYHHYEISNFAYPHFECRYNLNIWEGGEYVGIGPSAWSCSDNVRFLLSPSLSDYITDYAAGAFKKACFVARNFKEERWMLSLRLADGLDMEAYQETFGQDQYLENFLRYFPFWVKLGLVKQERGRVALTKKGWLVQNTILEAIFYG